MPIRPEQPPDHAAIHDVNVRAFGQPAEAELVAQIRNGDGFDPALSLVAALDDDAGDAAGVATEPAKTERIVGHILFSPIQIETDAGTKVPALALAPMAVLPECQSRGIGSQLVRAGLVAAMDAGHKVVVVLGHEAYYPRFGFEPASTCGIRAPFDVPDAAFMVLALTPDALRDIHGVVRYPSVFDGL